MILLKLILFILIFIFAAYINKFINTTERNKDKEGNQPQMKPNRERILEITKNDKLKYLKTSQASSVKRNELDETIDEENQEIQKKATSTTILNEDSCNSNADCAHDNCSGTCNEEIRKCYYSKEQCNECNKVSISVHVEAWGRGENFSWELKNIQTDDQVWSPGLLDTSYTSTKWYSSSTNTW